MYADERQYHTHTAMKSGVKEYRKKGELNTDIRKNTQKVSEKKR